MFNNEPVCPRCGKPFPLLKKTKLAVCPECLMAEQAQRDEQENAGRGAIPDLSSYTLPARADHPRYADWCVAYAMAVDASDIHFKTGVVPHIRKGGIIFPLGDDVMTDEEIFGYIKEKCYGAGEIGDHTRSYDFSFSVGGSRFRGNAFHDMNGWSLALRHLWLKTYDFSQLGIPEILKEFARRQSGLVLVTGPTGSGKTTTLTCLLDYINHHDNRHIITLEDPVEFIHVMDKCLISQREIGKDTVSYEEAIVEALREDPDIILVGEMRDRASIEAALRAAETGHLVLSTLHTRGTASTVNRIIDIFPMEQQQQIRTQLALCLIGTVSQQLVPSTVKGERCLATEIMRMNSSVRAMILENKVYMMNNALQTGGVEGMHTMAMSLEMLRTSGRITAETAEEYRIK